MILWIVFITGFVYWQISYIFITWAFLGSEHPVYYNTILFCHQFYDIHYHLISSLFYFPGWTTSSNWAFILWYYSKKTNMLECRVQALLKTFVSARLASRWRHQQVRCICTGSEAITSPVHYLDGKRVEPTNTDVNGRYPVMEPATGWYSYIKYR